MKRSLLSLALLAGVVAGAHANLIFNGDFESGDTGFYSDYTSVVPGPLALYPEGVYTVDGDASNSHPAFSSQGDNTFGWGNFMIVNGAADTSKHVWAQTIAVQANTTYTFSFYGTSVHPDSPAQLFATIDGLDFGSSFDFDGNTDWDLFTTTFTTGSAQTTLTLGLRNANGTGFGNDFGIDDLSVQPVPEPATMAVLGLGALALVRRRHNQKG